jgi:hypothetical protein
MVTINDLLTALEPIKQDLQAVKQGVDRVEKKLDQAQ